MTEYYVRRLSNYQIRNQYLKMEFGIAEPFSSEHIEMLVMLRAPCILAGQERSTRTDYNSLPLGTAGQEYNIKLTYRSVRRGIFKKTSEHLGYFSKSESDVIDILFNL